MVGALESEIVQTAWTKEKGAHCCAPETAAGLPLLLLDTRCELYSVL